MSFTRSTLSDTCWFAERRVSTRYESSRWNVEATSRPAATTFSRTAGSSGCTESDSTESKKPVSAPCSSFVPTSPNIGSIAERISARAVSAPSRPISRRVAKSRNGSRTRWTETTSTPIPAQPPGTAMVGNGPSSRRRRLKPGEFALATLYPARFMPSRKARIAVRPMANWEKTVTAQPSAERFPPAAAASRGRPSGR